MCQGTKEGSKIKVCRNVFCPLYGSNQSLNAYKHLKAAYFPHILTGDCKTCHESLIFAEKSASLCARSLNSSQEIEPAAIFDVLSNYVGGTRYSNTSSNGLSQIKKGELIFREMRFIFRIRSKK